MNIQPTRPGQTRGNAPERIEDAATGAPASSGRGPEPETNAQRSDRVELSQSARDLQRAALPGARIYSLSDARMKNVLQKLSQGFYDRPEVREDVLRRLFADLGADPAGR